MKQYTVHVRDDTPPVLVREAFSWGALFFGPLWFIRHWAWIPALLALAALAASLAAPPPVRPVLCFGVLLFCGVLGGDGRRWSLARRRFRLDNVVVGRNREAALFRLLTHRAELRDLAL